MEAGMMLAVCAAGGGAELIMCGAAGCSPYVCLLRLLLLLLLCFAQALGKSLQFPPTGAYMMTCTARYGAQVASLADPAMVAMQQVKGVILRQQCCQQWPTVCVCVCVFVCVCVWMVCLAVLCTQHGCQSKLTSTWYCD
jgi:hypothetical protein